jgi:hypothetical protein
VVITDVPDTSRKPRNHKQFLTVRRSRPEVIAIVRFDGKATQLEKVVQFPAIGPAQGHLTSVRSEDFAIGTDFGVSPDVTTDLSEMVEFGLENLADVVGEAPSR